MLICVSANPAIDRRLWLEGLAVGGVNRARAVKANPGGKAAHVAMAAHALGEDVVWVGFLGGTVGDAVQSGLGRLGISTMIVRTGSETRVNLEIIEPGGTVTEILEPGAEITPNEVERLLSMCGDVFAERGERAQVALSGSLPPGAPLDLYAQLTRAARGHGCRVLLDTSGEALRGGLEAAPDLVKPNREEASWLTGCDLGGEGGAAGAARRLFAAGARSVAITLGAEGLFWQRDVDSAPLAARPPRVDASSTVGCGDAALAGLAVAHSRGLCDEEAIRLAAACGAANCLAEAPGMIDPLEVERLAALVALRPAHAGREAEAGIDLR
jgi:1-phosphofructokinase family hexose kinase